MVALKITLGLLAFLLAWIYLFRTGLVYKFNNWMREGIFSDKVVLFSRRRMAILMFVLGSVALFSGLETLIQDHPLSPKIVANIIEQATEDFQKKKYARVVKLCKSVVKSNPKNGEAWKLLASAWWTLGEKKQALMAAENAHQLNPHDPYKDFPVMKIILDSK